MSTASGPHASHPERNSQLGEQAGRELPPFKLERYFAKHEFSAPHLMCCSDCEPLLMSELLSKADAESLDLWQNLKCSYTDTQGHPVLRQEISKLYETVSPDDVVVLAPEEGIFLSMYAILQPGDTMVVTYPGYASLYEVARSRGCKTVMWEPRAESGRLHFDVDDLAKLMSKDVKLLTINFPHNPTGDLLSHTEFQALVGMCEKHGAYLFSDEMYRGLELDETARLPSAVDACEKAIVLCGLSKSLALPGLRIGWLASKQQPILQRVLELKDYTTICNGAPSEILAIMALRRWQAIVARNVEIIQSNVQLANTFFLGADNQFEWHPPLAGSVAFPRLTDGRDVQEWCDKLVRQAGILLLPATVYDPGPSAQRGHFRIGLGRRDFGTVLEKFAGFVRSDEGQ